MIEEIKQLATVLKTNPGATIMLDNDAWQLYRPPPVGYYSWNTARQTEWHDKDKPIATNADFPNLLVSNCPGGLLSALGAALDITIDQP